jgi:hypothetical protein
MCARGVVAADRCQVEVGCRVGLGRAVGRRTDRGQVWHRDRAAARAPLTGERRSNIACDSGSQRKSRRNVTPVSPRWANPLVGLILEPFLAGTVIIPLCTAVGFRASF